MPTRATSGVHGVCGTSNLEIGSGIRQLAQYSWGVAGDETCVCERTGGHRLNGVVDITLRKWVPASVLQGSPRVSGDDP